MKLQLQCFDWIGEDFDGAFAVRAWGLTKDGVSSVNDDPSSFSERVLLRIEDYLPFCRIELPSYMSGRPVKWSKDKVGIYIEWISGMLKDHAPEKTEFQYKKKLYNFVGDKTYPFLTMHFASEEAMKHCVNLVKKQTWKVPKLGYVKATPREGTIKTLHRFITDVKIGYGQWFSVDAKPVDPLDKISICPHEFTASFRDIVALEDSIVGSWTTSPLIAAIDIETYSTNHGVMPNRDYVSDVVYQCSFITQRLNRPETRQKTLLVFDPCADIDGANVIRYEDEISLIDGLVDLLTDYCPVIITGYNIYGYDIPYLDARLKLRLRNWKSFSLVEDRPTVIEAKSWYSAAYGTVTVNSFKSEGSICIDIYSIVKKEYKLDRYSLDHVSHHFLKRGKHDITARRMFEVFELCQLGLAAGGDALKEAGEEMSKVGEYCLEDSTLCIDLMHKLNIWTMLIEIASIVGVKPIETVTRGQQLRVLNQVYQYANRENFVMVETDGFIGTFGGGHVQPPIPGLWRNILIFDFASLYPSIIRLLNICYTTLVTDDSSYTDDQCNVIEWTEENTEKTSPNFGKVTKKRFRFIKKEIFHGILPRMCENMVRERAKTRAKISPENDPGYNSILDQRQNGLKITANSIYGSLGVSRGYLPLPAGAQSVTAIGRRLIGIAADYVREKHGGEIVYGDTDSIMVDLKITDPNLCIPLGEKLSKEITGLYSDPMKLNFERAFSVCLFIKKKRYAGVPLFSHELKEGETVEQVPFAPEFEDDGQNLYRVVTKKEVNYFTTPKEHPPTGSLLAGRPSCSKGGPDRKALMKKGIIIARRDSCLWARDIYESILIDIMFGKPLNQILEAIDDELVRLMTRQVAFSRLLNTRAVGANYKPDSSYPLKIFVDELRKRGKKVQASERIDFVYVRLESERQRTKAFAEKQGMKMRTPEMYWENILKEREEIDRADEPLDLVYYAEKSIVKPIQQIVNLAYAKEIEAIEARCLPEKRKRGKIYTYVSTKYIDNWILLLKCKENVESEIRQRVAKIAPIAGW